MNTENCREVPDPDDSCCKVTICDDAKPSSPTKDVSTQATADASSTSSQSPEDKKGRAIKSFEDSMSRLDDVTMDDDDDLQKDKKDSLTTMLSSSTSTTSEATMTTSTSAPTTAESTTFVVAEESCVHGEEKYKVGQTFDKGCRETCLCGSGGIIGCEPKCKTPFIPAGSNKDETCMERPAPDTDGCCVTLVCTSAVKEETTSASTTTVAVGM